METYALTTAIFQRRALFPVMANAELLVKTLFTIEIKSDTLCMGSL
jgi:hypothetical protein